MLPQYTVHRVPVKKICAPIRILEFLSNSRSIPDCEAVNSCGDWLSILVPELNIFPIGSLSTKNWNSKYAEPLPDAQIVAVIDPEILSDFTKESVSHISIKVGAKPPLGPTVVVCACEPVGSVVVRLPPVS